MRRIASRASRACARSRTSSGSEKIASPSPPDGLAPAHRASARPARRGRPARRAWHRRTSGPPGPPGSTIPTPRRRTRSIARERPGLTSLATGERCGQAERVTALCLVSCASRLTQGADDTQAAPEMHRVNRVMREYDEDEDLKRPRPVRVVKKESNEFESAEAAPWRTTRKD